jgi:glycosyltransferase involved in cell wall biosynthesis
VGGDVRPDVDVIIPVRNGGRLLRRAVDSVLDQDGVSVRVIVADDGSTDRGLKRLPRDPRIVVLPNARDRGVPGALDTALYAGDAPYVARQDADDESLPGRFAAQLEFLEAHDGIGFVATAFEILVGGRTIATPCEGPAGMLEKNPICAGSVMVRREVIERAGGHRSAFKGASDYDCWLRCAWVAGVGVIPFVGYRYRLTSSMSMIRRRRTVDACADLARASARARMEGRPDPVDDREVVARVLATEQPDPEADAELLAWWAREFAALGDRGEALRCALAARGLPWRRRVGVLGSVVRAGEPQVTWS